MTRKLWPGIGTFAAGDPVYVNAFGRWYPGKVTKVGRTRVYVRYFTGNGKERTSPFDPSFGKLRTVHNPPPVDNQACQ